MRLFNFILIKIIIFAKRTIYLNDNFKNFLVCYLTYLKY